MYCAVADKLHDMSGKVLENCSSYKVKNSVKEKELGEKLWNVSLQLCGLAEPEMEVDIIANETESAKVEDLGPKEEEEAKKEK